ncbi:MAG TPA: aminopeptidase P family protein [Actinomycetota bacterium]|nr:aminopeptidase P family protein [Actinomycetota bacterium]
MAAADRVERTARQAARSRFDAVIVTPSADMLWLTGYDPMPLPRLTCLVIRPGRPTALVVPKLEQPLAEAAGIGEIAEIVAWGDTDDPHRIVSRIVGKGQRVACSDRMWASHLLQLQRVLPKARFFSASKVLAPLRSIKDQEELTHLRRAARYADESFGRILRARLESATEREVAGTLEGLLLEMGNDRVAFTIVGSGPNAASPHHEPGDRQLQAGDALVMDFGGTTAGYNSDITRTVSVTAPTAELQEVYGIVREAQDRAFSTVAPGVPAQEVDRAAREVIESAGYGDRFIHRTGHGIGLEVHEDPYLVEGNDQALEVGMCFSIEPGIYLPGRLGVRIEDIVTVTQDGAARLNHASRDLEVVA